MSLPATRLVAFAAGLVAAAAIVPLTAALGGSRRAAALLAAAFFCHPVLWIWLPLLRVDFIAVACALLGLYAFARHRSLVLASVCFAAAALTKQTAVAAPIACALELALERRWRDLGVLTGATGGLGLVVLAALGPGAWVHLVVTHRDPFNAFRYAHNLMAVLGGSLPLGLAIAYGAATRAPGVAGRRLAWLYVGSCTLLTLTAGKAGAETNHFIEWIGATSVLAALALSGPVRLREPGAAAVAAAILAIAGVSVAGAVWRPRRDIDPAACARAYRMIQATGTERILSEDVAALLLAGKPVGVTDPFAYTQVRGIAWEHGGMGSLVNRRYLDVIVLGDWALGGGRPQGRWPSGLLHAVEGNYRQAWIARCSSALAVAYVRTRPAEEAVGR